MGTEETFSVAPLASVDGVNGSWFESGQSHLERSSSGKKSEPGKGRCFGDNQHGGRYTRWFGITFALRLWQPWEL